jgi:hypothetical protein
LPSKEPSDAWRDLHEFPRDASEARHSAQRTARWQHAELGRHSHLFPMLAQEFADKPFGVAGRV